MDPMSAHRQQGEEERMEEEEEEERYRWKMYEAYNDLHGLAQDFSAPFDAPAILVIGHQTDGKSALVEALMGFQFNHVGGGTKTRCPITLHMSYHPDCHIPTCHLLSDPDYAGGHRRMDVGEVQDYIEAENMRLENAPCQFSEKEIIIKIEYKHCPNLTIIDTPGLILPAPGPKNRALQGQARAVEALVRAKMQHKEFIILCLEECSDWSNATTRRIVMQIDPELSRTVIVSTKLDTKVPQFARSSDVEVFLKPPASILDGCLVGDSPFFTSVPSGRVGSGSDSVYSSNEEFKKAISLRELEDIASLEGKLGRPLSKEERSRIGVSSLRSFLEELLQKRYKGSVPLILPLLEKEYRSTMRKLHEIHHEIRNLDEVKLREKGRAFHDSFLTKLSLLLKGTVVAPPDKFGETLQDERTNAGMFVGTDGLQFPQKMMPLGQRLLYILKRLLPISVYLLQKDGEHLSGHDVFLRRVEVAFNNFAETTERACRDKCMEDLLSTTRYVTWSLHNKNRAGLRQFIDSFSGTDHSLSSAAQQDSSTGPLSNDDKPDNKKTDTKLDSNSCSYATETRLVDLLDCTLWNRRLAPSSERIVYALVHHLFHGIKEQFLVSTELKFNCFLLMPVVDKLPILLREDLESAFEDDLVSIFDLTQLRSSLGQRQRDLEIELKRIQRLRDKFREMHDKLKSHFIPDGEILSLEPTMRNAKHTMC